MDELTALLVLSLQLEDVNALLQGSKGKNPVGKPSDADIALSAYRAELLNNKTTIEDRRMGRSISDAVRDDGSIIATVREEERSATQDREMACRLGGVEIPKQLTLEPFLEPDVDVEVLRQLSTLNCSDKCEHDNDEEGAEGSSSKLVHGVGEETWHGPQKQCVACQDNKAKYDTLEAPCTHTYCRGCVSELFEAAITDESLYPPRCCRQDITMDSVKAFLSDALISRFTQKALELETTNRTYCVSPACSTFIPPAWISGEVGTCPMCQEATCTVCKKQSHAGDCPNDEALQGLLTTAAANGWQRCYSCRRMVELDVGCNHMTYVFCITHSYVVD